MQSYVIFWTTLNSTLVQNTYLTSAFNDGQKEKRHCQKCGGIFVNK